MSLVSACRKPSLLKQAFASRVIQSSFASRVVQWLTPCSPLRSQGQGQTPNLQVTEEQYKDALHALLVAEPPLLDMRSKLGPVFAKHLKQVTPGHLVSLEKLWYQLINKGCKQLVLQSNKIKLALFKLVHENSVLIPSGTLPVLTPVIVDDVKQHIMDCAAIMRALKNEGMSGARHYNVAAG